MTSEVFWDKAIEYTKDNWFSIRGLGVLLLLEILFLSPWLYENFGEGFSVYKEITFIGVVVLSFVVWLISWGRRYPTSSKGKIGIVVAITTEYKNDYVKLRTEFVNSLLKVINENQIEEKFDIVELPNFLARKVINNDTSMFALKKTKCHFIFYGSVVNRDDEGKSNLCLNLDGMVIHRPIPVPVSGALSQEFAAIFPKDVRFPKDQEVKGFKLTKDWMNIASKYMIAVAAFISGDFQLAFRLNEYVYRHLQQNKIAIPNIDFLKNRVRQRLIESLMAMTQFYYFSYRKTKDIKFLLNVKKYLDLAHEIDPHNYYFHMNRAIYYFKVEKNTKKADQEIAECENEPDGIWRFSRAFLRLYEGRIDAAIRSYKRAVDEALPPEVIFEIEEFLMDVVENEPDKCQLWYAVGIFNWKVKGDYELAKEAFEKFIACGGSNTYSLQKPRVRDYIIKLEKKIEKMKEKR